MVFASLSLEQGLQISISCLEPGILFAILTLEPSRGDYFAARIVVQTNVVAVPARVPLHVHSNTPFQIRRSTSSHVFQSGTGYLFSQFCLEQGSKIASLWSGTGSGSQALSGTPHPKLRGVPPPPRVFWMAKVEPNSHALLIQVLTPPDRA